MKSYERQGWIAWFAYNPVAANLLMIGILLLGLTTAVGMRTEGFPAEAPRTVSITVAFDGASPRDVEEGAAVKVERALNGLEGIKKITSTVSSEAATISVQARDGYSLTKLKEEVQSRVDAITGLPAQVSRTTVAAEQEDRHVIFVQVSGHVEHRTLKHAAQRIRADLLKLATISKVTTEGASGYEISVELSEQKLRAYDLSPTEVANAVQGHSVNLSAGKLETDRGTFTLQSRHQAYSGSDLEQIVVRSSAEGGIVRLKDVAQIVDGFSETPLISLYNGEPSIRLGVQLTGKDSITAASDSVTQAVAEIEAAGWVPEAITLSTWSDEAQIIRDRLNLMSRNAVIGMGLVFLMLALFLNVKVAAWVAVGIPISFAGTLYVIGPVGFDYSLNDLTTFAFIIVLGIVVDDAIVIGENIYAHKQRDGGGTETAVRGAKEVATPATFGVLTTVAAFLPLTMISSEFGGPFKIIAVVVIVCLLFSLVESKLILPAHLASLLATPRKEAKGFAKSWRSIQNSADRALGWVIKRLYAPVLKWAINNLLASILLCLAVLSSALGLVTRGIVPTVFFPDGESAMVYVDIALENGAPAHQAQVVAKQFEASLAETSVEYQKRYGLIALPVRNRYISSAGPERLIITVELAGGTDRSFAAADFAADWRKNSGYSAIVNQLDFYTGFSDIRDLEIELSAPDPRLAEQAMEVLANTLAQISGVNDIKTSLDSNITELTIDILPLGERLGLTNRNLITQLRNRIHGFEAQKIRRGEEEVSLRVRLPRENRDSRSDLERVLVKTPQGGTVPLTKIAVNTTQSVPKEYYRVAGQRVMSLAAKVDRAVTTPDEVLAYLQSDTFPELRAGFPGLQVNIEGEAEQEGQATAQLANGFCLALLAIFTLLAIPLKSYLLPLVIMCAIPFGIVGAVLGTSGNRYPHLFAVFLWHSRPKWSRCERCAGSDEPISDTARNWSKLCSGHSGGGTIAVPGNPVDVGHDICRPCAFGLGKRRNRRKS